MGVDVVNLVQRQARFSHGHTHGERWPAGRFVRGFHIVCVVAGAITDDFGIATRASLSGRGEAFEDERGSAFANNEAVAAGIEWLAGLRRVRVRGHAAQRLKARHEHGQDRLVRATTDDHPGVAPTDRLHRLAHGGGAGGAGGGGTEVGPLRAQHDSDVAGGGVREHVRDEEGAHATCAPLLEDALLLQDEAVAAAGRPEDHAHLLRVRIVDDQARVGHRLLGGDDGVLGGKRHPA